MKGGKKIMNTRFKKIVSVIGSVALVGSSMGVAMAAGGVFPEPFAKVDSTDFAVVYGANAAMSDLTAANNISAYLNSIYVASEVVSDSSSRVTATGDFSSSVGVNENEIVLGGSIIGGDIRATLFDNKIPTLIDSTIDWDGEDISVHEELIIREMNLLTTLDNSDLNSSVVLENDQALEYKYVFEEDLKFKVFDDEEASAITISILGIDYELEDMTSNSFTAITSEERVVSEGDVMIVEGVTLTVKGIYSNDKVQINNKFIKEGYKATVNGIEVYVDSVAYKDGGSRAIIKVGKDISKTFSNGDEYVEDDETWEWVINNLDGDNAEVDRSIGVKYMLKNIGFDEDEPEENAIAVGGSYVFPENYAAVIFNGLTNVTYEDLEISFDDKKLYDGTEEQTSESGVDVVVLEGENEDSFSLIYNSNIVETDTVYLRSVVGDVEGNWDDDLDTPDTPDTLETWTDVYFKDINRDVYDSQRIQFAGRVSDANAKFIVSDTELLVEADSSTLKLSKEGVDISVALKGSYTYLGALDEDAEKDDVKVGSEGIGTREDDVMDHYGIIIENPENNADDDRVVLSVPSEQVFADVSVLGQGNEVVEAEDDADAEDVAQLGNMVFKDSEVQSVKDKNLIVVGGSCINSLTASLMGGKACGTEFTAKTGVAPGKYIIQSFVSPYNVDKVAVVVAGYEAADTTRAVNAVREGTMDLSVGKKYLSA